MKAGTSGLYPPGSRETISVALCTFNGAEYLEDQLESINAQTLPPDELIISDDGSTDGTIEIAQNFQKRARFPVTIIKNPVNLGVVKNFEQAIQSCAGEYIFLCDQDDVWDKKKVEKQTGVLKNNPQLGYVFSDAVLVDGDGASVGHLWKRLKISHALIGRFNSDSLFQAEILLRRNIVTGATMAFRRKCLPCLLPFPANSKFYIHDGWCALNMSLHGFMGFAMNDCLISYRQHSGQLLGAPKSDFVRYLKSISRASETAWLQEKIGELEQLKLHAGNAAGGNLPGRASRQVDEHLMHLKKRMAILIEKKRLAAMMRILREILAGGYKKCPVNPFCWITDAFIVLVK